MSNIRSRPLGLFLALAAQLAVGDLAGAATPPDTAPTVLITGSSRGIGLEFARQYADMGWRVIATCRDPAGARELQQLAAKHGNLTVEAMDITSAAGIAAAAAKYRDQPIDVLVNNAAHLGPRSTQQFGQLDWDLFGESFQTNAVGPMRVIQAFAANVATSRQKRIVTLSSAAGSIAALSTSPVQFYQYRASKAALNMLMHGIALDLAGRGIVVGIVNPGLVDTRGIMALKPGDSVPDAFVPLMPLVKSGALKLISPAESVGAMIRLIAGLTPAQSGRFLNYDGQPLPW